MIWWLLIAQATTSPYFAQPPALVRATTSNNSSSFDYARYTFEIEVSSNNLGGLVINLPERFMDTPEPGMVSVYSAQEQPLPIQVAIVERQITINFTQPVMPQKISVYLAPMRNPRTGGTYLFDIAAFPVGNATKPQFLGFGRISFIQGGRGR